MQNLPSSVPSTLQVQQSESPQQSTMMPATPQSEAERQLANWGSQTPSFLTNLTLSGEDGLALATRASAASDQMTAQAVGRVLRLKGFVLSVWDITDTQTGEVKQLLGGNLVTAEGELIGTTSPGVLRCLNMIGKSRPKGEWSPPVNVLIEAHKGNHPGPYYTMRVLTAKETESFAKKKS